MSDRKSNFLITLVFDENQDMRKQINTELAFKEQVIKDLQHLVIGKEIKHFVVADDEIINKKLIEERKVGKRRRNRMIIMGSCKIVRAALIYPYEIVTIFPLAAC